MATLDNTRTVFHYTRDKSQQLAGQRGAVQGEPLRHPKQSDGVPNPFHDEPPAAGG